MRNANHVVLPTIIDEPGRYLTRNGEIVVIAKIDRSYGASYAAHGSYPNKVEDRWDVSGRLYPSMLSNNDIIQKGG